MTISGQTGRSTLFYAMVISPRVFSHGYFFELGFLAGWCSHKTKLKFYNVLNLCRSLETPSPSTPDRGASSPRSFFTSGIKNNTRDQRRRLVSKLESLRN